MTAIVIDKKKYVLIKQKDYQDLHKKAALKTKPAKTFTIEEARAYSKKLVKNGQEKNNCKTAGSR